MAIEINKALLDLCDKGYAPCLVSDDNGRWAVSCSGIYPASGEIRWMNVLLDDVIWCDTPESAVEKFLAINDINTT
jgi:hypothetical protein